MKLIIFPSVAAMVVMLTLVVRQEMNRNTLKAMIKRKTEMVSEKDKAIVELKRKITEGKPRYQSLTEQTREMNEKINAFNNEKRTLEENIKTCQKEKEEAAKGNPESNNEHVQAKETAQKTIQDLKQKNLDREKAICALIDTTIADARKLCGLPDAPQ